MDSVADFANSPVGLLLVGFVLTAVVGTYISSRIQLSASQRQTERELQVERYRDGTRFLAELSELAGMRFFGLQRWLWAIGNPQAYEYERERRRYYELVAEWNHRVWANRATLRLLVGSDEADSFLDYRDDGRGDDPHSLHYLFARAHQHVLEVERGALEFDTAQSYLDTLNHRWSAYVERVTSHFLERAASLRLLEIPTGDEPDIPEGSGY